MATAAIIDIIIGVGAKISEYLVKPIIITPLRPIFCFKTIVNEFKTEMTNLVAKKERVENAINQARNKVHEMGKYVDEWLNRTNEIIAAGEKVQRKVTAARNRIDCCSLGWTCRYCLSRQVQGHTSTIKKHSVTLEEARDLVSYPMDLLQLVELPQNFIPSKSASSALFQVMEALMDDSVSKIGLYGAGGAGKTALAKFVFAFKEAEWSEAERSDAERSNIFKPIMVTVPQSKEITIAMAIKNIQGTIADFLGLKLDQETDDGKASRLRQRLGNGDKILVILDDVMEELDLAQVGIPSSTTCKVLLTTNNLRVCSSMKTVELHNLNYEGEAWALFKCTAGVDDLIRSDHVTDKVISYCNGIPKALVKMGEALRGTEHSSWEEILQQFKNKRLGDVLDLQKENDKLRTRRVDVQEQVKKALNNAHAIREGIKTWLTAAEKAVESSEKLVVEARENKSYSQERHKEINMKALEQTTIVKNLWADGDALGQVGDPAPISQYMGLSSSEDFLASKSAIFAYHEIMVALGKDDVNMIGLYGMGGIGKTTLAKHVCKEVERSKIFDRVLMVTVSQTPAIGTIQQQIADFLLLQFDQGSEIGRASKLRQRFEKEKILIILDDVWKLFDLASIGLFMEECKGCKILLTTRRLQVCTVMSCQINIPLDLLSKGEAWDFFKKKAHLQDGSEMGDVAQKIVGECGQLPIALATVGSALRNKNKTYWDEALKKLGDIRLLDIPEVGIDDKNAYKCLRLSYDYLQHSKPAEAQFLLLLCSLFPEDSEIDVEALTRCAFGMKLFKRVESVEDARGEVEVAVQCLIDSCLLLENKEKRFVKVHDVVRDVALWIGGTESPGRCVFVVRDKRDIIYLLKEQRFRNCRALSFMANSLSELSSCGPLECPKLEAMFVFGGSEDAELPDTFFQHMKALKVLDIRLGPKREKPHVHSFTVPRSLGCLTGLQVLNFKNCYCLRVDVVGELNNLNILSFAQSILEGQVETVLLKGKELRLLDLRIRECYGYHLRPNVIANMIDLEEFLGAYPADDDDRSKHCWLSEVNSLEKLVTLTALISIETYLPVGFCFPYMKSYTIRVGNFGKRITKYKKVLTLNNIKKRWQLEAFKKLFTTVETFDLWHLDMGEEFTNNIIPCWVDAIGFEDPGSFLQDMKQLCVAYSEDLEALFEFGGQHTDCEPKSLQRLELDHLWNLRHIWKVSQHSRFVSQCNLTHVKINMCPQLKAIFSSAMCASSNLAKLENLCISLCDGLEEVVSVSGDPQQDFSSSFKKLRKLEVSNCRNLKAFFSIMKMMSSPRLGLGLCLPELQDINLYSNKELEHVFAYQCVAEAEQCPSLQVLTVHGCPALSFQALQTPMEIRTIELHDMQGEAIMQLQRPHKNDDQLMSFHLERMQLDNLPGLNCILSGNKHNICFSFLTQVSIYDCSNLKQLFTVSIAPSFTQLESLCVEHCTELEEIFCVDNIMDDQKHMVSMEFPKLKSLKLKYLRRLIRFCPDTYHLVSPSLPMDDVILKCCPKLIWCQKTTLKEYPCIDLNMMIRE